jgi:hypothetical protein
LTVAHFLVFENFGRRMIVRDAQSTAPKV